MKPEDVYVTKVLVAMHESPLACGPAADTYRFLFLHVFAWTTEPTSWHPTMGRISRDGDKWTVTFVRLKNAITGEVVERRVKVLTDDEARAVFAGIRAFRLWVEPTYRININVSDGATWVIEGRHGNQYRAIVRDNEDKDSLVKLAFVFFDILRTDSGNLRRPDW